MGDTSLNPEMVEPLIGKLDPAIAVVEDLLLGTSTKISTRPVD